MPALQWDIVVWIAVCAGALSWLAPRATGVAIGWRLRTALVLLALAPVAPALRRGWVYGPLDTNMGSLPWAADGTPREASNGRLNDLTLQIVPWQEEARRQMLAGHLPLLNPYVGAGQPLLGNGQSAPFAPSAWLALPFEAWRAQAVRGFVRTLLALLGAFACARYLGCRPAAAMVAAVAYAYGGSLSMWKLFPIADVIAWFPFAFLANERILGGEAGRAPRLTLIGALTAMALGGHPETLLAGAAALAARWVQYGLVERRRAAARVGAAFACALLAVGLSAPATLPLLATASRSDKLVSAEAAEGEPPSPQRAGESRAVALTQVVPGVFGTPARRDEVGPRHLQRMGEGAAGAVAWALAVLAWSDIRRGGAARHLLGLALLAFAALIRFDDAYSLLHGLGFPGLSPRYLAYLGGFGVAGLAALGAERLLNGARWRSVGPALAGAIALAMSAPLLAQRLLAGSARPEELARWRAAVPWTAGVAVVALALVLVVRAGRARVPLLAWLLPVAVALPLVRAFAGAMPTVESAVVYPRLAILDAIGREPGPLRVLGTRGVLFPNASSEYRLADVRLHDPTAPAWFLDWLADVLDVDRTKYKKQYVRPRAEHLAALRLLGVKFLLSGPELALDGPWIDRGIFGRTRLWELSGDRRFAFFPHAVEAVDSPQRAREMLRGLGDAESSAAIEARDAGAQGGGEHRVESIDLAPSRLRLAVTVPSDAWLVVSQAAIPGWRARGDGRPLEVRRADGALLAVRVPSGTRTVELRYLPTELVIGGVLAALAAAFTVRLALYRPRTEEGAPGASAV